MKTFLLFVLLLASSPFVCASDWKTSVQESLPLLGHRNWIVIVDSAYPWQASPGIETIETGASQTEVTRFVLNALAGTKHVKPTVYIDKELDYVTDKAAPGVTDYRNELGATLKNYGPMRLEHEKIIAMLDDAGKTFHVLVLKTTMTMPYTSVFLQLECGYWNAELEQQLRQAMAGGK